MSHLGPYEITFIVFLICLGITIFMWPTQYFLIKSWNNLVDRKKRNKLKKILWPTAIITLFFGSVFILLFAFIFNFVGSEQLFRPFANLCPVD